MSYVNPAEYDALGPSMMYISDGESLNMIACARLMLADNKIIDVNEADKLTCVDVGAGDGVDTTLPETETLPDGPTRVNLTMPASSTPAPMTPSVPDTAIELAVSDSSCAFVPKMIATGDFAIRPTS
jgi:hypothetical protein